MSGYSKMSKSIGNSNPMDPIINSPPPFPPQPQPITKAPFPSSNKSALQEEEQQSEQQNLQPQLRRNASVSAAASRVRKRALSFSTMRSSSVSERYCRIHDQSEFLADHGDDHVDGGDGYGNMESMQEAATVADRRGSSRWDQKKKVMSRSRIIRACKKILGL